MFLLCSQLLYKVSKNMKNAYWFSRKFTRNDDTISSRQWVIDTCKDEKVHVIFVQPEFDRRNAELIAKQTGTRVVDINPLSYDWEAEMMHTAKALAEK